MYSSTTLAFQATRSSLALRRDMTLHVATNVLGPFLMASILAPALKVAQGRVIWPASLLVDTSAPLGGIDVSRDILNTPSSPNHNYTASKVCNWMLAAEMARHLEFDSVTSLAINPGSLWTGVWRWQSWCVKALVWPGLYHARYGAYTYLWAGLADIPSEDNGGYVIPWGRWHPSLREDITKSIRSVSNGGTGVAEELWKWCEKQVKDYS